jgi:starvation-inducible DNA-binding protein
MQAPAQSQQYSQQTTGGQTTQRGGSSRQSGAVSGPVGQRFPTRSYLSEDVRTTSIGLLNKCLADLTAVNMQLKDAHWNVKGIEFYQLHELFEDIIEVFGDHIDEIAERASALGGQALGTAHDVVQTSAIPQLPRGAVDGRTLLNDLRYRLSVLDSNIYQAIETADRQGDLDTADLLNEVSRDVSKSLWFIEAHLQGQTARAGGGQPGGGQLTGIQSATFGGQSQSPDSQWQTGGSPQSATHR